ncbi:MAG: DegT/DnrJ/EryC1/StrS family aminotransferase, partial [Nitrospiraceae bacterium]|nr:DegT/DnrJ/EryC1/StrS family aminotransferase [Nitrospiraceae bacterium]
MKIPFLDLKTSYQELQTEVDDAFRRIMNSGWYIMGKELMLFEEEFAAFCHTRYCIGVGNGLEALHLIMRGFGIGPGDEVIVPSNTYIATWLAISYAGATPIPVEPDEKTYNLNPSLVERAITVRTKAIMPVHLYGQPADMDPIRAIAIRHGLAQRHSVVGVVDDYHRHYPEIFNGLQNVVHLFPPIYTPPNAAKPPSTGITAPVINAVTSENRASVGPTKSSGSPKRLIGVCAMICSPRWVSSP